MPAPYLTFHAPTPAEPQWTKIRHSSVLVKLPQPGVEPVSYPIAEEVQRHDQQEDADAGEERNPPRVVDIRASFVDHGAPCRVGGGMPAPRKLRIDSVRTICPTLSVARTMTVLMTPGRMCLMIILKVEAPATRARAT